MSHLKHITIAAAVRLGMAGGGAAALTPAQPCSGPESGMLVDNAAMFGPVEGFVYEFYGNLDTSDGVIGGADGPIPELNDFHGFRITECRTGRILAVSKSDETFGKTLLATEFLREKEQNGLPFTMRDITNAVRALYGNQPGVRILNLRETEETCGCRVFFPGMWKT